MWRGPQGDTNVLVHVPRFHGVTSDKMGRRPRSPDPSRYSGQVAERLRRFRSKRDLTQSELSSLIAEQAPHRPISTATISDFECGRHAIGLDDLPVLAKALGVPIHKLLPRTFIPRPKPTEAEQRAARKKFGPRTIL